MHCNPVKCKQTARRGMVPEGLPEPFAGDIHLLERRWKGARGLGSRLGCTSPRRVGRRADGGVGEIVTFKAVNCQRTAREIGRDSNF